MASINLSGILTRPDGEPDVGAVVRFTHYTTTGNTVKYSYSELVIPPDGAYNIDLEYGQVRVDYDSDYKTERFISFVVVNQDSTATSIPELLNASVPPTDEQLLEFQALLADTVAAKDIAVAVSEQITTTELINGSSSFTTGDVIETSGFATKGDGGGAKWQLTSVTGTPSQTPAQIGNALLNDADGRQWKLVFGRTLIIEKIGGVAALQAALNSKASEVAWFTESLNLDAVKYTVYSGQHLHGPGVEKSTLYVNSALPTTTAQFENEHPNFSNDNIRHDKDIKFSGFTIDCSARKYPAWLTNLAGDAITDPEFDYSPSGIIGQGGDIFDVVAADRRNPNYSEIGQVIRMIKVERPIVENVRITGHESLGVTDEGCLSMRVRHCVFDDHGKIDNVSSAVWAQSFGDHSAPLAGYQDTEDHVTEHCQFTCKRSAITLNPTRGGAFRFNTVFSSGESTVFSGSQANANGGSIHVHNNKLGATVLTDIVASHVENNGNSNYHIYNNNMSDSDGEAVNIFGSTNNTVYHNTISSPWRLSVTAYPYGPFSERYGFDVGKTPIAGETVEAGGYIRVGTLRGVGANVNVISDNTFIDENSASNAAGIIELTKSGGDNLSKNISIHSNDMNLITDKIPLYYQPVTNVMASEMSLESYGNAGIESSEPVIYAEQFNTSETGVVTVEIGFRPRRISVYVALNSGVEAQSYAGEVIYSKTATEITGLTLSQWNTVRDGDLYRVVDGTGTVVARADFISFTETGFIFNNIVVNAKINIRAVCHP